MLRAENGGVHLSGEKPITPITSDAVHLELSRSIFTCLKRNSTLTKSFIFFFLLFRQLADDEALIIFLQTSQFLVSPYAVNNCMCLSSKSSLTLSNVHPSLPLSSSASFSSHLPMQCCMRYSLFPSIFSTCPNHVSLLLLICFITVSSAPSSSLVFSSLILSLLLLSLILRNHVISATSSLLSSSFLSVQHSDPYIDTGRTSAQHSFMLVLNDMFLSSTFYRGFPV